MNICKTLEEKFQNVDIENKHEEKFNKKKS